MPCFCESSVTEVQKSLHMGILPMLPPPPLSMALGVALPSLTPENRLDMQIATGFDPSVLPPLYFGEKPLFGMAFNRSGLPPLNLGSMPLLLLAQTLSMLSETFSLDDLPALEMEMAETAQSIERNVWPCLGRLTSFRMEPLLNFANIARLTLDLQSLGIDPFAVDALPPYPQGAFPHFNFALTAPQVSMARTVALIPNIMSLNETLSLPPLNEPGSFEMMSGYMSNLAALTPPNLAVQFPKLQKLALVIQSLDTIEEAFGPDAFGPWMLDRIETMLAVWNGFSMPLPPLEPLALNAKLESLPSLEAIQLGLESAQGAAMAMVTFDASFSPPDLAITPFLNLTQALSGSFQKVLEIDPFDMCGHCPFA